jgi:deoxycytidylate deaminase
VGPERDHAIGAQGVQVVARPLVELAVGQSVDGDTELNCQLAGLIPGAAGHTLYGASKIREARFGSARKKRATPLTSTIHFLRSLKHPDEVHALRRIYVPGFFLIGLHVTEPARLEYLRTRKGLSAEDAQKLIERDEDERREFGQRTRDTFQLSDVFIRNDVDLVGQVERFVQLIFSHPHITPTRDEHAMFLAYAASLRSADLSRQVGAIIVSSNGETIATGANDVPRYGGGQYWANEDDHRDHALGFDSNAREIQAIVLDTLNRVATGRKKPSLKKDLLRRLAGGRLYDLTEFGRAVHAEMEALTCCARASSSP